MLSGGRNKKVKHFLCILNYEENLNIFSSTFYFVIKIQFNAWFAKFQLNRCFHTVQWESDANKKLFIKVIQMFGSCQIAFTLLLSKY